MGKRAITIDPRGTQIALTVHNAGVRDRVSYRDTVEDAATTCGRWGLKSARKHVDAAVDSGEIVKVGL